MLKRSASSSPDRQGDVSLKPPRITLPENTEDAGLRTPAPSVTPSHMASEIVSYQPKNLSDEPVNDAGFLAAFQNVSRIASRVVDVLESFSTTTNAGSSLSDIIVSTKELQNVSVTGSYVIGLVGDAGQGKSSTVNSLLDQEGLAKIGESGVSVTAFVTEFRQKEMDQETAYLLKAQIMPAEDIDDLVRELLIKATAGLPTNPEYEENRKELSKEELEKLEDDSASAFDTLCLIFADDVKYIDNCNFKQGYLNRLITKLHQTFDHIKWPSNSNDGTWTCSATTVEECQGFVNEITKHRLSPFIQVLKVYLHSPILNSGVVLADIPGFRDTNGLKVRAASKYVARCDGLVIVNEIGRIVSNLTVLETIRTFRRLKPRGTVKGYYPTITVVATRTNDVSNPTHHPSEGLIDEEEFTTARKAYQDSKKEVSEEQLWRRYRLENVHIVSRNALVTEGLKKADPANASDIPLAVFCVDNQNYFCDTPSEALDHAFRRRSGIIELRDYCMALPARQRFKSMNNIIANRLANPIQSLAFWLKAGQNGHLGYKEALNIEGIRAKLIADVDNCCEMSSLMCLQAVKLLNPQRNQQRKDVGLLVLTWTDLPYSTLKAFCRRDGFFRPRNGDRRDWNEELMNLFNQSLPTPWIVTEQEATTRFDDAKVDIDMAFKELIAKACDAGYPLSFTKNLELKRKELHFHIETIVPQLKKELDILHGRLTEHGPESNVAEHMARYYQQCAATCGKGAKKECVGFLNKATQGGNITNMVFTKITSVFLKELEDLYKGLRESLGVVVQRITRVIQSELDQMGRSIESGEVLAMYPDLGKEVQALLEYADEEMEKNEAMAENARAVARERGYID